MGRENILEDRVTVAIVLERQQLKKLDKVAGLGNRSAYVRWLIDIIDEKDIKRHLMLEAENKVLKRLPAELEKVIKKRESKIQFLQMRVKALKEGKPTDLKELPGIDDLIYHYSTWKEGLRLRGIFPGKGKELDWIHIRAKNLDMEPRVLLDYVISESEKNPLPQKTLDAIKQW